MNEGPPIRSLATFDDLDDTERELTIGKLIVEVHDWLARTTDATPVWEFSSVRAYAADIATMTRRLGLSVDLRLDALLVLRLAERATGKAVRRAQAAGELGSTYTNNWAQTTGEKLPSPIPYVGSGNTAHTIYQLVDGVTDTKFTTVLAQARAEGKLSRSHLIRKLAEIGGGKKADGRRDLVDQTRDAAEMLRRVTVRLRNLHEDDRLGRRKADVAARIREHLVDAKDVCEEFIKTLDQG